MFLLLVALVLVLVLIQQPTATDAFSTRTTPPHVSDRRRRLVSSTSSIHTNIPPSTTTTLFETTITDATTTNSPSSSSSQKRRTPPKKKVAVLLCPAQFCVPQDYDDLWASLPEEIIIHDDENDYNDNSSTTTVSSSSSSSSSVLMIDRSLSRVVPLSRRDWIKVSKQLPTRDFWNGSLQVHKTLDWYFEKLEAGLSEILWQHHHQQQQQSSSSNEQEEEEELSICLVGHSIGGWVARAYLGGLSRTSTAIAQPNVVPFSSLITLGTPHISPSSALVDQTRGLLQEIADAPSCSSHELITNRGIAVTCVCSSSFAGSFLSSLTDPEQLVAASSYLPLLGRSGGDVFGDGIVPLDLAFMEAPAQRVVLTEAATSSSTNSGSTSNKSKRIRHSHVLPTPWNLWDGYAPSIPLDASSAVSYVSPEVVPLWSRYIR